MNDLFIYLFSLFPSGHRELCSDEEDSMFYRGFQSASFSARVKRTRDHLLSHFLPGSDSGGGGAVVAAAEHGDEGAGMDEFLLVVMIAVVGVAGW